MKWLLNTRSLLCFYLPVIFSATPLIAQTVTITIPVANDTTIITGKTISFEAIRSGTFPGTGIIYTFTWTASPSTGVNFNPASTTGINSTATSIASFSQPGTYLVTCTVQRGTGDPVISATKTVTVFTPNLFSAVNVNPVRAWNINPVTGAVLNGPAEVFTPLANTAALAKNRSTATDPNGCLYYMENTNFSNTGNVNLFAANPDGSGNTFIATADINGVSTAGLGFVRIGFDPQGNGWIVAGDFTTLYLASFVGNGTSPTTITTVGTITISGSGSANEFQNGDLAISGVGAMYIVANITGGETYVYVMNSLDGPAYTLTRRWKLVQPGGTDFTVSVNGVAFTQSGSLHVSSFQGLYFIDQTTANSSTGTVECAPVYTLDGLTDLASDQFPLQSALPVNLISFTGNLNNNIVTLRWEAENEINFSHYEIERKITGSDFISIGNRSAANTGGRINYNFTDNLSGSADKVFFYRLKMIDLDGTVKYSNTIMLRKEDRALAGISLSPNPLNSTNELTIRFNSVISSKVTLTIIDMSGKIIWQQHNNVMQGNNSLSLRYPAALIPGVYMIQLRQGHDLSAARLLITE